METAIRPSSLIMESTPMLQRLAWWLLPPLLFIATLFTSQWALASSRLNAAEAQQQQQAEEEEAQKAQAAQAVADAKAQQQFALEIRSIGVTVDRFRQMKLWQRIDEVNNPWQNVLVQDPQAYPWDDHERDLINTQRANKTLENTLRLWVERWPIPVLVSDGIKMRTNRILWAQNGSGLGIHMFTGLGAHQGEGGDVLVQQLFRFFDENPTLPAAVLLSFDSQEDHPPYGRKERFIPTMPDSMAAILVTRTDRVNQFIRPYAVDVPYDINKNDTKYDVIKLWNFFFPAERAYTAANKGQQVMPTAYWNEHAKTLISQVDPNAGQGGMIPFWHQGKEGFKPTPWMPVRWTKWQLEEEYDRAPLVGYLHRPIEVKLTGDLHQQTQAMAVAWKAALATLPDGQAPQWLFYDTAGNDKRIIPFSSAMALPDTPHKLDFSDAKRSYNLTRRVADTGASSPFIQLGLATMRSYDKGGVSATLNLRQDGRASIIMVSPPSTAEKAKNKPNDNNGGPALDPSKPYDPFVEKRL
ncbi:type VI lipase adapter Tla3 domain-containing protein [Aquitalea aquatica]|uniref:DUF2875 family protein n=1 Tax=Aquitalea aquatica TaxID=3044273 RepID=A0A838Y0X4_9NEIS|nr:DUF2875 family protein [Aquitalea magnusonii]MBA4709090.1 DUF2875 family protein [Aquitalea magnusonii]